MATITGTNAGETLNGTVDRDIIDALGGDDIVNAGAGEDWVAGGAGVDILNGDDGGDALGGGADADTLNGGAGDDILVTGNIDLVSGGYFPTSRGGADILDGGEGLDYGYILNSQETGALTFNVSGAITLNGSSFGSVQSVERITFYAGSGNDQITVRGGSTVWGGNGADVLTAVSGVVVVDGVSYDLVGGVLHGEAGADVLNAGDSDNDLDGGSGDDQLIGGSGDTNFNGGVGANTVSGGDGIDTIDYSWTTTGVRIDFGDSLFQGVTLGAGPAAFDRLTGIERASGGSGDDIFVVRALPAMFSGLAYAFYGRDGHDLVDFSLSPVAVWVALDYAGTHGWTQDRATLSGGVWRPMLDLVDVESLIGSSFDDYLRGDGGANTIFYTGGRDYLDGAGGVDTIDYSRFGSAVWVDTTYAGDHAWTRDGATVTSGAWRAIGSVVGAEILVGTNFSDSLFATLSVTTVRGGDGDDLITARAIPPGMVLTLDGGANGAGGDTASFAQFGAAIYADLTFSGVEVWTNDGSSVSGRTGRGIADLTDVESVVGTAFNDVLIGTAGDNLFAPGLGANTITAGGGVDTLDYSGVSLDLAVDLQAASDQVRAVGAGAGALRDQVSGVESVITGAGADTFKLTLNPAGYVARFDGGAGIDSVDYSASTAAIWFNPSSGQVWTQDQATLTGGVWRQAANAPNMENVIATAFADQIFVTDVVRSVQAGAGDDLLMISNGAGSRLAQGGTNGAGGDTAHFGSFGSAVWVDLTYNGVEAWTKDTTNLASGTWREFVDLSGIENLVGTAYDDYLKGDAGANRLTGGAGQDTLVGAAGADTFVFTPSFTGRDTILDFAAGVDKIELETGLGAGSASHLHLTVVGADTIVTFDTAPSFQITLSGVTNASAGDFLFT